MEEYNNGIRFDLTYESPVWDPHSPTFAERETNMVGTDGLMPDNIQPAHKPITLAGLQIEHMNLGQQLAFYAVSAMTTTVEPGMSPAKLAKNWGIGLETAKQTLKVTTQRGVRTVLHPSLSRRYRTNDRQLQYRRLGVELFSDTMEPTRAHDEATSMLRFSVHAMVGYEHSLSRRSLAHMKVSLLCLPEMVFRLQLS
jgi:hypothetical protein